MFIDFGNPNVILIIASITTKLQGSDAEALHTTLDHREPVEGMNLVLCQACKHADRSKAD